jgi:hypothetical protein
MSSRGMPTNEEEITCVVEKAPTFDSCVKVANLELSAKTDQLV